MKCISLWQPWASLWCSGVKVHETRHWPTNNRGWILVHAARRPVDDMGGTRLDGICDGLFGNHWGMDLPRGAIVGAVKLVDCVPTEKIAFNLLNQGDAEDYECGNFESGRYGWRASEHRKFANPIAFRGSQGFFNVPDDLVREAMAA